eukprot:6202592-Pleurochrysis_carterae.AAC.5
MPHSVEAAIEAIDDAVAMRFDRLHLLSLRKSCRWSSTLLCLAIPHGLAFVGLGDFPPLSDQASAHGALPGFHGWRSAEFVRLAVASSFWFCSVSLSHEPLSDSHEPLFRLHKCLRIVCASTRTPILRFRLDARFTIYSRCRGTSGEMTSAMRI